MTNKTYFKRFFDEKDLPSTSWSIEHGDQWYIIGNDVIIEHIKALPEGCKEQLEIVDILRKLDFMNRNINDFLRILAEGFVKIQMQEVYGEEM